MKRFDWFTFIISSIATIVLTFVFLYNLGTYECIKISVVLIIISYVATKYLPKLDQ